MHALSQRAANDAPVARSDDDPPAMLWTARPDLSCEWVSRAWCEFTGHGAEAALGEGWSRRLHPEDLGRWLEACVRAFDARASFEIEYRMRGRDGRYRWMLDRGRPRYARDGTFLGYVGACVDIEERKRAELELARVLERERRLRHATEQASRIKDELVGAALQRLAEALDTGARGGDGTQIAVSPGPFFQRRRQEMNWDTVKGNWKQVKGKLKEQWGKLTDDEFDQMAGNRDQLVGKIQERYGIARDEADRQVRDWESRQRDL